MGLIRPATPGFLVTLGATILLALVSFGVPLLKSIYFLKGSFSADGFNGSVTFGTLGYCLELPNGTSCSKASVGYELDVNTLFDNNTPIKIPEVVIKWVTYALVLHIVALALAGGSAVFGLLAHVREMSMTCCSTFVSGFAAFVAMVAFIFDLVLFFVAKARINSIPGGHAEMGIAIWLTLAAWLLLFFSGCFYTIGRCCIHKRPRGEWNGKGSVDSTAPFNNSYGEQMRLDAVKAEADRKARQKQMEVGLPAFHETQPLTGRIEGDNVYLDDPNTPNPTHNNAGAGHPQPAGYVQGEPGTRAVDEYYNPTHVATATSYPPQRQASQNSAYPQRQNSYGQPNYSGRQPSIRTATSSSFYGGSPATSPPPPLPNAQYLHSNVQAYDNRSPNPREQYGHTAGGTTYQSAAAHQQYPSSYSQYDPYNTTNHHDPYNYNNEGAHDYSNTAYAAASNVVDPRREYQSGYNQQSSYYTTHSSPPLPSPQPQRQYTLGGDGYGGSTVPALATHSPSHDTVHALPYPGETTHAAPYPTSRGPRMPGAGSPEPEAPPPMYEASPEAFPVRREKS